MSIMPPGSDRKPDPRDSDYADLWTLINCATDPYYSHATGMCGGCGSAACHQGACPGNLNGYCTACPERRATGQVR